MICNILNILIEDIPVVTLKRTDTTLDLSQKAKRFDFLRKRKVRKIKERKTKVTCLLYF
ncbi:hypothetical protein ACU8KH_05817 [Lachancea thermotolerans]